MSAAESRVALLWGEGGKGFNQCSAVVARLENVCVIVKIQCMERPGGSRFPQQCWLLAIGQNDLKGRKIFIHPLQPQM